MVVECDAGRKHVDEREATMPHARLDQRHELRLVAGEAARHEGGAERERQQHGIDGRTLIHLALLGFRADIRGGGELALGEPINAVVLDQIQHVHIAPDRMHQLAEADRQRIAVAGHADVSQLAIGGIRTARDRGHASMHRVEAVRAAHEIRGGLRGAADAGELHQLFGPHIEPPAGLDDRGRDRIVPAAGAQRGHAAFVLTARHAERVGRQGGMGDFGLVDE